MASRIIGVSRFDVKHGLPNDELFMKFFSLHHFFRVIAAVVSVTVYWSSVCLRKAKPVM